MLHVRPYIYIYIHIRIYNFLNLYTLGKLDFERENIVQALLLVVLLIPKVHLEEFEYLLY